MSGAVKTARNGLGWVPLRAESRQFPVAASPAERVVLAVLTDASSAAAVLKHATLLSRKMGAPIDAVVASVLPYISPWELAHGFWAEERNRILRVVSHADCGPMGRLIVLESEKYLVSLAAETARPAVRAVVIPTRLDQHALQSAVRRWLARQRGEPALILMRKPQPWVSVLVLEDGTSMSYAAGTVL